MVEMVCHLYGVGSTQLFLWIEFLRNVDLYPGHARRNLSVHSRLYSTFASDIQPRMDAAKARWKLHPGRIRPTNFRKYRVSDWLF